MEYRGIALESSDGENALSSTEIAGGEASLEQRHEGKLGHLRTEISDENRELGDTLVADMYWSVF